MTVKNEQLLIIGGSDAGISAAIQAKESEPTLQVKIILADEYPNLSICGFPYAASREVPDWHSLSHRGLRSCGDNIGQLSFLFFKSMVQQKAKNGKDKTLSYP